MTKREQTITGLERLGWQRAEQHDHGGYAALAMPEREDGQRCAVLFVGAKGSLFGAMDFDTENRVEMTDLLSHRAIAAVGRLPQIVGENAVGGWASVFDVAVEHERARQKARQA